MTDLIAQIIEEAVRASLPRVIEGARRNVQLGDGTTLGTVIVPPVDPRYFPGAMYCFEVTGGTKTIHIVENRWPGLTYDNSPARTWVQIGYPPGSKRLAILGPVPGLTTQYSQGPLPVQSGLVQAMEVTPDRIASLRLIPQETLVVGLTPGRYVIGETVYTVEQTDAAFLDVTSYLPAGPDQDKWLLVGIDKDGNAQVTTGSAFDEDDDNPGSFAPAGVPENCYLLGYLRLNDDLAGFQAGDNRIIPAQGQASVSGNVFRDDRWTIRDNLDPTKQAQFQLSSLSTATTVVLSPPPASDTLVGIVATQTLTNKTLASPVINTPTISGGVADNFVIGSTTPAAGTFSTIQGIFNSSQTTTASESFGFEHRTSGTPAAGFGVTWRISAHSSTNAVRAQFRLTSQWVVATDASRTALITLNAFDTVARECIRLQASGTAAMIGFLGANAAVRQTGGAATAGATYGTTEQTMLQVVYNMARTFGLLT